MSSKAGLMIGVLTTVFFVVIGGSFLASAKPTWGLVLLGLAAFRAMGVLRQWQRLSEDDEDA